MSTRISAALGLDVSGFRSGLEKASGLAERFKRLLRIGDVGGGFRQLIGAGALIQGFRSTINAAQEARDRARELGRTVDAGTASVARYGDAWDGLRQNISGAAIAGLGFFTRIGEVAGNFLNDNVAARFRFGPGAEGRAEGARVRGIAEEAGANADRLASPAALEAARRRGEERRRSADQRRRADDQSMGQVSAEFAAATAAREEAALEALPAARQIEALEARRAAHLQTYNNAQRPILERAKAFSAAVDTEIQLAAKKAALEKEAAAAKARAQEEELAREEKLTAAKIAQASAAARVQQAGDALATAQRDALRSTPQELARTATGRRDTTASGVAARGILRDEATARRLARSGGSEELFDFQSRRTVQAGAEFFQRRALDARGGLDQLTSGERNPFAGAEKELSAAGKELSAAAKELKTITLEIDAS